MGGLGKTTLAQLVYKDELVKNYFEELTMWVHVSENFDVENLLTKIMESSTQKKFDRVSNFEVLETTVREQLNGKRYLLVLDDLWNEAPDQWERLYSLLRVGGQGSKILITTRKTQVADVVKGGIPPYQLQKLQDDECWSIIEKKAFSPGGALPTAKMESIGRAIADKCSGLPLAAKFLGSLMHLKNKESNWISIRGNDMWWNTPESKIISILKLSYDNLSPHLQRCFSYCSIFPKNWELSKLTLIQLWMAEGFLQPSKVGNDCSLENTGEEYFESLMWSSFFDGVEKNELDDVMTFKMHDLVHDLAQAVVGDNECAIAKVTDPLERISEVRRLNIIVDKYLSASISNIKKLRTIISLERKYHLDLCAFSSNKYLRILHVGSQSEDCSIEYSTSMLKQLRYFHISNIYLGPSTLFRKSSFHDESFSRLHNLQTLGLSRCKFVKYLNIGSLKFLRHLDISFSDIDELPNNISSHQSLERLDLNHCKHFTTFPDTVSGLKSLRFLDMSFTLIPKIPFFVTRLHNLRTLDVNACKNLRMLPKYVAGLKNLSIFNFKDCPLLKVLPKDFGDLTQLRCLSLGGTEIGVLPESCDELRNLEYVDLFWCELPKEVTNWVNLRKFNYKNMGTPMGIGKLKFIEELSYRVREKVIKKPEFNDGIEELGNLIFLKELNILDLQNVNDPVEAERANLKGKEDLRGVYLRWGKTEEEWGQQSCIFQVFEALQPPTSLIRLGIEDFMGRDLPSWLCISSHLVKLEKLGFTNCSGMQQLPACIGHLPCLKHLHLTRMSFKSFDIGRFPSLIELSLTDMLLLEELCYSYPSCLRILEIDGCKKLTGIPSIPSLTKLVLEKIDQMLVRSIGRSQTSLRALVLKNIGDLIYFPVSILQNNCNLQVVHMKECNQVEGFGVNEDDENENVVSTNGCGISLQKLEFADCPVLKRLPNLRGWTSLQKLSVFNCPQLNQFFKTSGIITFRKILDVDFIHAAEEQQERQLDQALRMDIISDMM